MKGTDTTGQYACTIRTKTLHLNVRIINGLHMYNPQCVAVTEQALFNHMQHYNYNCIL